MYTHTIILEVSSEDYGVLSDVPDIIENRFRLTGVQVNTESVYETNSPELKMEGLVKLRDAYREHRYWEDDDGDVVSQVQNLQNATSEFVAACQLFLGDED
jgi:hypothetical protein